MFREEFGIDWIQKVYSITTSMLMTEGGPTVSGWSEQGCSKVANYCDADHSGTTRCCLLTITIGPETMRLTRRSSQVPLVQGIALDQAISA